ncbi:MAG: thioesterase family protein [Halobacteriovoraceae bacterium]|nr:thioesterase family protein [Halobacteriovoraceae bacterium]
MAKVKISLPSRPLFKTNITLRVTDLNYGGHLGNDSVLSLCHEARYRLFRAVEASERDVGGAGIIMADAAVVYQAEAFAADILETVLFMDDWGKFSFDLYYLFTRKQDGKPVAKAKTGIVFFDYNARKIVRVPADFKNGLEKLQSVCDF